MKKYWKSLEQIDSKTLTVAEPEFSTEGIPEEEIKTKNHTSRRDFLKILGFGVGYATLAASCETPVNKAIPFLNKPQEITPGVANYYASTFYDGHDFCNVLVKTREGRPIKIEGNELSDYTKGGTTARVQASVLNLYDSARFQGPQKSGAAASWDEIDKEVTKGLEEIAASGEKIVIFTSTVISPSTKQLFKDFAAKYPTTEVVYYDAISYSAMLDANLAMFNQRVLPDYHFDKAELVVSFGADFLGNWISPMRFTKQYSSKRKISKDNPEMLKHVHFESTMSLTGSNADFRIPIKPSEEGALLVQLYNQIASKAGKEKLPATETQIDVVTLADELWGKKGKSLVVSGSNDFNNQAIVNAINYLLGNYGTTINIQNPVNLKQGDDAKVKALVEEMNSGKVGAMFLFNVNPAYDYPEVDKFTAGLAKVKLSVSFDGAKSETANLAKFVCPDNNYLESWNDAEIQPGKFSLAQPTIHKLFDTRQAQESLLKWAGMEADYYAYIQKYWENNIYTIEKGLQGFESFWNKSLHDGVTVNALLQTNEVSYDEASISEAANAISKAKAEGLELQVYENIGLGDGKNANNPWLQELPDPVSKVCWDNYVAVSYAYAKENQLEIGDMVKVNGKFELPVLIQPGQADGTIAIALGYGRTIAGPAADNVGKNAFALIDNSGKNKSYTISGVKLEKTGVNYTLALTQEHNSMEGRDIVRETKLIEYKKNPKAGNEKHYINEEHAVTLYPKPDYQGHHWGLAVDLNACTGCSACVIACQAENNVPVIGREEVINRRIMHWMKIDRYYSDLIENPEVVYQPIMCQHCDNAPCENVCPVAATPHSSEGLNQMAYNRCIGTRYCMNNCPYRVRRFNWFQFTNNKKYAHTDNIDLSRMVLNPDVVVRTRGVVEKCTFCVQRIQEKKLLAKNENRALKDGEIVPACQQSCSADALVFGDLNDKESNVSKAFANERNYSLLEQLHTLPSVGYLTKVRNKEKGESFS
jgi:MoCo/4Fe-4S cofactor protein with predicted Tat translocation signal